MGTTITAAIVDAAGEEVAIGHVGDSRAYRLRDGKLERLTRDHSLVEEMRRKGQLTDAQAEDHPQRSIITRALGPEPEVEVDVQTVPALPGDVFLLCSDGLTTMLGEEQIAKLLAGRDLAATRRCGRWSTRPTAPAAATTSPRSPSGSRTPRRRPRQPRGRDADRPRAPRRRADRDRGAPPRRRRGRAASGASSSRRKPPAARLRRRAKVLAVAGRWSPRSPSAPGTATARSGSSAPTTAAGSRSTAAFPTSCRFGIELYERALREPDPDRLAAQPRRQDAVTGHDLRSRDDAVSLIEDIEKSQGARLSDVAPGTASCRPGPGRAPAHRRLRRGLRPGERPARQPQPDLRRLLPRRLPRHPPLPADPAARRRPLPVPAGRAADRLRPGDDLPDRRDPGPRPGQLVRPRARPLRADDPLPARLRRARALPLHDRRRRPAAAAGAAPAGDRPAGQRRLPRGRRSARSPSSRPSSRRSASSSSSPATCASTARC